MNAPYPPCATAQIWTGLLGGSFDPGHLGHVHITRWAQQSLGLESLWWLMTHHNPQKPPPRHAIDVRQRACQSLVAQENLDFVRIMALDEQVGSCHTLETVLWLKQQYPDQLFVWILGADQWNNLHTWHRRETLVQHIRLAVMNRMPWSQHIHESPAGITLRPYYIQDPRHLRDAALPAWTFIQHPPHPGSSTELRQYDC